MYGDVMLRKILMGAAVLATSSFATFSNFPVPAAQSGEVKIVSDFTMQGDWKDLGLSAKGRFVPVQNLELYLKLPFTVVTRWEGHDADKEGMKNLTFGGRYQIISTVAAFLDVTFPTGKDAINDDGFSFYFGGQYSKDFGAVALGSEVGLTVITEGSNHKKPPMVLSLNAELDPNVSPVVTPYFGATMNIILTNPQANGHKDGETSGDVGISPYVGANIKINQMFSFDVSASFTLSDDYLAATCDDNTKTPITLSASFNASFK